MAILEVSLPTYAKVLIGVGIILVLLGIFIGAYLLNKKTKAPDNCPKETIGCGGCMLNCGQREAPLSIDKVTKNVTENYHEDGKGTEDQAGNGNKEEK
jgi:hypothetical protein